MTKKFLSLFLSVITIVTLLVNYCVYAADESSSDTILVGQVTAISGNSITLALGEKGGQNGNGTQSSEAPTGDSSTAPDTSEDRSGSKDTEHSSTPPSDVNGSGGMTEEFTLSGETQTINITDDTVITIGEMGKSTSGSLSDITVGSILMVKMSGDTVSAVSIRQNNGSKGVAATASTSTVTVNGSAISLQAYNINGSNYFKLRDIAQALNTTDKQFEVGYDSTNNAVTMTSKTAYTAIGGELKNSGSASSVNATLSTAKIYLDGKQINLTAYSIEGSNYFKLRDLASALDFSVTYDSTTSTIAIDTATGYTA